MTKSFLSRFERGQVNASVDTLISLCRALEMPLGHLFDPSDTDDTALFRANSYVPIEFGGNGLTEFLLTPPYEKRIQVFLSEIGPGGGSGIQQYDLPISVEFVFVLSGTLHLRIGADEFVLNAQDAFSFDGGVEHSFHVDDDDGPARVLWVLSPALQSE
jgi:quercetin dioxygenase-like cupin family protein